MRKVLPRCCASEKIPTSTIAATDAADALIAATGPNVRIVPIVPAVRATTPSQEPFNGDRPSSSLLPPTQDLPFLRSQCAEDRLQGHASAFALHFRTRQDR